MRRFIVATSTCLAAIAPLATAGCARTSSSTVAAETTPATTPPPSLPTSTRAATTTVPAPATTQATTTTVAPTTTTVATLPVPVAPPEDAYADEPELKLGSIEIPALGVSKSLYSGITLTTLNKGPGHWPGTALPGQYGNAVVAGHRTSKDRPFHDIHKLVPGDTVVFVTTDGRFEYEVTSTEVVLPDAMWIVDQTPGFTATLFACHPIGSTRERIVVHLALVSTP